MWGVLSSCLPAASPEMILLLIVTHNHIHLSGQLSGILNSPSNRQPANHTSSQPVGLSWPFYLAFLSNCSRSRKYFSLSHPSSWCKQHWWCCWKYELELLAYFAVFSLAFFFFFFFYIHPLVLCNFFHSLFNSLHHIHELKRYNIEIHLSHSFHFLGFMCIQAERIINR